MGKFHIYKAHFSRSLPNKCVFSWPEHISNFFKTDDKKSVEAVVFNLVLFILIYFYLDLIII